MKTFNKKTLCAALAGLGVLGMAGAAQAVSLNPDGLGQALIYPYYTVRANADGNTYDSMLSVVNSTNIAKAVKVRFLEGKASHEVLDFNLYLSRQDVWTAVVSASADGAQLSTTDKSCTYGNVLADGPVPFRNVLFSGNLADGAGDTLDRTREGYVEIIEMADILAGSPTAVAVTHVNGVPANCGAIIDDGEQATAAPAWATRDLTTPTGGLFGNMTLINVNTARAVGYDAVALDGFYDGTDNWTTPGPVPATTDFLANALRVKGTLWFPSGNMNPNLSMAYPAESQVISRNASGVQSVLVNTWTGTGGPWIEEKRPGDSLVIRSVYTPGLDAVSSVLMRSAIYNEYMNSDFVNGATDWVVTMPTKGLYYDRVASSTNLTPRTLFQSTFTANGAPDTINAFIYDREEKTEKISGSGWSPALPAVQGASLRWEANVINFQAAGVSRSVFNSANFNTLTTPPGFEAGWAQLAIDAGATTGVHTLQGGTNLFTGLPVVGFAATLYDNASVNSASLGKVWASYVATVPHRYSRTVTP